MNRKTLFLTLALLVLSGSALAVAPTITPQNTNNTGNYNTQFNTGVASVYGSYPNADIYYDGTNLVIDVIHGGGKVSIPDGIDVGSLSLGSSLVFEGATADAFETTLSVTDPTADRSVVIPDASGTIMLSTLATNAPDVANSVTGASNALVFEGATANSFETSISATDPTADQVWTIANFAVNAAFLGTTLTTNNIDAANSIWGVSNGITFEGATADTNELTLVPADPGADVTVTIPAVTGTICVGGALVVSAGANTACNTTCGAGKCCGAQDTAAGNIVGCADATADRCTCMP